MISEKRNNSFLYRIKLILGNREKHPWGRSLGLRNTRINAIFSDDKPPKADALIRISEGENVSIDWLLTGKGEPYLSPDCGSDSVCSAVLHAALAEIPKGKIHLLYGSGGQSAVVITHQVTRREEKDLISYTAANIYTPAGPDTLEELKGRDVYYSRISADELADIKKGREGYLQLMVGSDDAPAILKATQLIGGEEIDIVREDSASYDVEPSSQDQLLKHYQNVGVAERAAVLTIMKSMDRTYEVNQLPFNMTNNPDSKAKSKPVTVDSKVASTDEVGSED